MRITTLFYFINLLYMEFIFHLYFWKDLKIMLLPAIGFAAIFALVQSLLQMFLKGKANKCFFWVCMAVDYLLFASQLVYRSLFKQPLMLDAAIYGGQDALSNYWREAIQGIVDAGLGLLALALGMLWTAIILYVWKQPKDTVGVKRRAGIYGAGIAGMAAVLTVGFVGIYKLFPEDYEEYQSFGYPDGVLERFGVLSFAARDIGIVYLPELEASYVNASDKVEIETTESVESTETASGGTEAANDETETGVTEPETPSYGHQALNVNYEYLKEIAPDSVDSVTDLVFSIEPSYENEYTGLFEGYNLIYITAEGFSTAAIDPDLTPTLYQLTNSGVVVPEYYVPLWQTSTSDGEYVNLTGLIPDQQFSMKRSAENSQPYSLANYFKSEGAVAYAYHNNTLSYYDRHLSHPNLGYNFKASQLGNLSQAEWGDHIFQMEHPGYWPASDLEMMQATVPEYVNEDRFHVYYMTVSGHMNYNFRGNKMSALHQEEVADLPYSEEGKAYIACNIELDRALAYLIQELSAAGKLEETVICVSADHYPYGMEIANYEELMGMDNLENSLDIYRNSLILWNSEMDKVVVEDPCSAVDLMPTLLNLFGFEFDSRLYSGRDIFSTKEPLVVFANRSFITRYASYNKKTGEVLSRTGEEVSQEYIDSMKDYVRLLHKHSAGIINNDYYAYFSQAVQ